MRFILRRAFCKCRAAVGVMGRPLRMASSLSRLASRPPLMKVTRLLLRFIVGIGGFLVVVKKGIVAIFYAVVFDRGGGGDSGGGGGRGRLVGQGGCQRRQEEKA